MSNYYVSVAKEEEVVKRSSNCCEYCLAPADYAFDGAYHIDHIIAESHGGSNELDNLALACPMCNALKGSNLSTYLAEKDEVIQLFHPRKDAWLKHFHCKDSGEIVPLSDIGRGTIRLLKLNNPETVQLRKALRSIGFL